MADVFDKYDLYDPTALAKRDQSSAVGAAVGAPVGIVVGILSGLLVKSSAEK